MSKNGIFPIFWPPVKSEGGPLRQKYLTTNVRPRMVYKRAKFEGSTQTCLANQVIWDVFTHMEGSKDAQDGVSVFRAVFPPPKRQMRRGCSAAL